MVMYVRNWQVNLGFMIGIRCAYISHMQVFMRLYVLMPFIHHLMVSWWWARANSWDCYRFRRNGVASRHMTTHSLIGWATWIGICATIWTLAFVIAELYVLSLLSYPFRLMAGIYYILFYNYIMQRADSVHFITRIPFFNDLLGVMSSMFAR